MPDGSVLVTEIVSGRDMELAWAMLSPQCELVSWPWSTTESPIPASK